MNASLNEIGLLGLVYILFNIGFISLFRRLRKQPVNLRSITTQAVLGGVIFMFLLWFVGGFNE